MKRPVTWFPWAVTGFVALVLAAFAWPRADAKGELHLREFGSLPAVEGGRVMPLDTVARINLMSLSHRQTLYVGEVSDDGVEKNKKPYPATKWLLDTMTSMGKGPALDQRVFRIENDQVLSLLELKPRDGLRYSYMDIAPKLDALRTEAQRARRVESSHRSLFDNKVLELAQHLSRFMELSRLEEPRLVRLDTGDENWVPLGEVLHVANDNPAVIEKLPAAVSFLHALGAYLKWEKEPSTTNAADFNAMVAKCSAEAEATMPDLVRRTRLEQWFNEFAPFYYCSILYALVAVIGCLSWLGWFRPLNQAALMSTLVIFAVHTAALVTRMYIQGRPPVTNLYSSAIFIGWGCVLTCLFVEFLFRNSIALVVGTVTGALSLMVAHFLSLDGDTLGMLQAVLDTNFWLATHVVCITLGYTASFVAGFMGIAYIVLGVATPLLARGNATALNKMTYGVVCFAMFLSFTGTVLGGIWADQSWGRFWGWDPKENGALLIVLWNALILHARWGGMVKQRGLAQLAVLGNAVTAWSWFGTNLLGVGLHSYGFMQGAMYWLIFFVLSQVAICAIGFIPLRRWTSFQPESNLPPSSPMVQPQ